MKADIHPKYTTCKVTCACGNTFTTRSTRKEIKVDICSACHPFFTGSQKFVDTAGRVDKFRRRYAQKSPGPADPEKVPTEEPAGQAPDPGASDAGK